MQNENSESIMAPDQWYERGLWSSSPTVMAAWQSGAEADKGCVWEHFL